MGENGRLQRMRLPNAARKPESNPHSIPKMPHQRTLKPFAMTRNKSSIRRISSGIEAIEGAANAGAA